MDIGARTRHHRHHRPGSAAGGPGLGNDVGRFNTNHLGASQLCLDGLLEFRPRGASSTGSGTFGRADGAAAASPSSLPGACSSILSDGGSSATGASAAGATGATGASVDGAGDGFDLRSLGGFDVRRFRRLLRYRLLANTLLCLRTSLADIDRRRCLYRRTAVTFPRFVEPITDRGRQSATAWTYGS